MSSLRNRCSSSLYDGPFFTPARTTRHNKSAVNAHVSVRGREFSSLLTGLYIQFAWTSFNIPREGERERELLFGSIEIWLLLLADQFWLFRREVYSERRMNIERVWE